MSPRRAKVSPRRPKMSPRSSKMSSGRSREASGSDFVRISEEFTSNARRPRRSQLKPPGAGRVAAAQGHKRSYGLAVSILGRLSPLSPCCCSLSCRSCSCCSCCSFCPRLACNACTPSSLTRFPFHDSQVSPFRYLFSNLSIFTKNATLPHENIDFRGPGGSKTEPKWHPKCFENRAFAREASGRGSGTPFGGPKTLPRGSRERRESPRSAPGGPKCQK